MIREVTGIEVEGLAGGKGKATRYEIVPKEELNGHGRLYARIVLAPGSSVGWHQHVRDTEPYYILRGRGTSSRARLRTSAKLLAFMRGRFA